METHVMSMRDEGDCVYHAVLIAPDHTTARRLLAKRMLSEYERSLCDSGDASLDEYAPASALDDDWRAEGSMNCPSCGAGSTRPLEPREMAMLGVSPIVFGGRAHVCLHCAATWISTGIYAPMREKLEAAAVEEISGLDAFEARSLNGGEEDDEEEDGPE